MKFRIQRVLTPKQMFRAKYIIFMVCALMTFEYGITFIQSQDVDDFNMIDENGETWEPQPDEYDVSGSTSFPIYKHAGNTYNSVKVKYFPRGRIVYYGSRTGVCDEPFILMPGIALLPKGLLFVAYGFSLIFLFLGIGIISDVFMNGIEEITAQTVTIDLKDANGDTYAQKKVHVWNSTVANLTLMALGSSAPEILLAVIETMGTMDQCPGELGAATIVGSAAFNLLVITGLSIYAVAEENDNDPERDETMPKGVKKIYDMGVFSVTATTSVFAYIWMYIVLKDQNVQMWEAFVTLAFFFAFVGAAFAADRWKAAIEKKRKLMDGEEDEDENAQVVDWTAIEMYRELVKDKQGEKVTNDKDKEKRESMKLYLRQNMKTDQIDKVDFQELKKVLEGEGMIKRIQYRKAVQQSLTGKRPAIAKGEIFKRENAHADALDDTRKNEEFGFNCLHYSVSEASGSIQIMILNKKKAACKVRVCTIDAEALAGKDYDKYDQIESFAAGEQKKYVKIKINDDDNWEPDKDFFIQLYHTDRQEQLSGQDTRTRVTIIDDDKPGHISYQETKAISALAGTGEAEVVLERKNGSDGIVTVHFKTIELDESEHTASAGVDFEHVNETITFAQGETIKTVIVPIIIKEDVHERAESFGVQLSNITPAGAKLSKKSFMIVHIVTDDASKKKNDLLNQLLSKVEEEEEISWKQQFINACMLHPTKNEDGEILDFEVMDGAIHFICIGWKLFFSLVPPAHYGKGWPTFILALCMIGLVTAIVEKVATVFGCVVGIPAGINAITFVALGTSLPDTFASMTAAKQEKYADAAVGNVTGSNSVNVFLGLGLPWVYATLIETSKYGDDPGYLGYYAKADTLGFNVVVFSILAITCLVFLVIRRSVVGGELGGSNPFRTFSAVFLISLWFIYVLMCILQTAGIIDIKGLVDKAEYRNNPKFAGNCYK